MPVVDGFHGFQLEDQEVLYQNVNFVVANFHSGFPIDPNRQVGLNGQAIGAEQIHQRILIHALEEAMAQFVVDIIGPANNVFRKVVWKHAHHPKLPTPRK